MYRLICPSTCVCVPWQLVELAVKGGMRFLGLISLMDPPKKEVPEAIRQCR